MQESKCLIHPLLQKYTQTPTKTFQIIQWMWTHNLRKRCLVQAKNGSFFGSFTSILSHMICPCHLYNCERGGIASSHKGFYVGELQKF